MLADTEAWVAGTEPAKFAKFLNSMNSSDAEGRNILIQIFQNSE